MTDVAEVTRNIRNRTHDDGFAWLKRNENLKQTLQDFKDLTPAERDAVVSRLNDADLKELADDVNAMGLGGANGLSADEKRDLFNTLATGLSGEQLGRLATAFNDRQDVMALGQAVGQHASSDVKLDFIKEMAPRTSDGDSHATHTRHEAGDKEAEAILEVLNSMGNDPSGFNDAIHSLDDQTLDAVVTAGINKVTSYSGKDQVPTGLRHDSEQLSKLLEVAARSADPAVKAKVFEMGAQAVGKIDAATAHGPQSSTANNYAVQRIVDKLSALKDTDAANISAHLQQQTGNTVDQWMEKLNTSNEKRPWGNADMYSQYTAGGGRPVSLSEMGLDQKVKDLVTKEGAFGKSGSIQGRFIDQIASNPQENTFENAYEFGDEIVWAMGGGRLEGEFNGDVIDNGDGTVTIKGTIKYDYSDRFEDPYDTFDRVDGSWDPFGTPYDVRESWTVEVNETRPK